MVESFAPSRKQNKDDQYPLRTFGYIFACTGLVLVIVFAVMNFYMAGLCVAAVLCGIAESQGRYGISHIGMIAPMKSIDTHVWFKCSFSYTICGAFTAYLTGLLIVGIGAWIDLRASTYYVGLTIVFCILFLLRELKLLSFNPPQCNLQTYKEWTSMFGLTTGVGMWGAHIGLALTTVITYGGLYCLMVITFGLGVGMGEWLFVAFWLGRVVLLWVTPWLMNTSCDGMAVGTILEQSTRMFRFCSITGISGLIIVNIAVLSELVG
ncbi:MAG: hypothetical protein OXG88_07460 [Gammaproteobacteria bacterium]|nr:hypothetical protein [Gammaproteobacteria bacterium]